MKLLFKASVVLNCVLAGLAARRVAHRRERSFPRVPRLKPGKRPASDPASSPAKTTGMKLWDRIEAPNAAQIIANLRAIGCPEQTIRDILTLRICRGYRNRLVAMETEAAPTRGYVRNRSLTEWNEVNRRNTELRNAMSSELESLLGESARNLGLSVLGWPQRSASPDFVSLEKRARLREIEARFGHLAAQTGAEAFFGMDSPEARAQRGELERRKRAALEEILSPTQFEEYQMRESRAANYVRNHLPAARSEAEFRAMVKLAIEFEMDPNADMDPLRFGLPAVDPDVAAGRGERHTAFRQRLKEVLGEERVAEQQAEEQARRAAEEARKREKCLEQQRARLAAVAESVGLKAEDAYRLTNRLKELEPILQPKFEAMEKNLSGTPEEKAIKMKATIQAELQKVAVETVGEKGHAFVEKMVSEMK